MVPSSPIAAGTIMKSRMKDDVVVSGPERACREWDRRADEPGGPCPAQPAFADAATAVSAVMLTMPRTVVVWVRMWTGAAAPSRIGPTLMP